MVNIVVLVSGGGTNLQALIDAERSGQIQNGRITAVVSSRPDVYALQRAKSAGIEAHVLERRAFPSAAEYCARLIQLLDSLDAGLVVLAGFMTVLTPDVIQKYQNRIINVHPALIPSFCGDGYYGLRVHQAALDRGVKLTGATVHFVNEQTDGGPIVLQQAVPVLSGDTPESLQRRVMEMAEWKLLPRAVSLFCDGKLVISGQTVEIIDEKGI